jgi:hypothetical protein
MTRRLGLGVGTTDVITIDALKLFAKVVFCEAFLSSRRKYRGTGMFKTVSKPLAQLNFLSGVSCYDIGSTTNSKSIVFFSAQIEIFSTDTELYVGTIYNRAEKLKCQKDFLHV